jgi:hypothetical protein
MPTSAKQLRGQPDPTIVQSSNPNIEPKAQDLVYFQNFETVGAPECRVLPGTKGYYEFQIIEMGGYPQMGWASDGFDLSTQERTSQGVGDDQFSYGIDGVRIQKWS